MPHQEGISVECQPPTFQSVPVVVGGGWLYGEVQVNKFEHVWEDSRGACVVREGAGTGGGGGGGERRGFLAWRGEWAVTRGITDWSPK